MTDASFAPQVRTIAVGATRNVAVSFLGQLDSGELLIGTPIILEIDTTDLTLGNKVVSATTQTIVDDSTVAGQAVQFNVSGGVSGVDYVVECTATTDASPAQVLPLKVRITFV